VAREGRKNVISKRFKEKYHFVNAIAIGDGSLFPLNQKPETEDFSDYHGRERGYLLTCMIINDDEKRLRHYLTGFPGSCHDKRVYRNTHLFRNSEKYFGTKYYLLFDSAVANSSTVVP